MSSARRAIRTSPATISAEHRAVPHAEIDRLSAVADVSLLPSAAGPRAASGVIRRMPADFVVRECLPFVPAGTGEHVFLKLRKTGQNTRWVAARLADIAGIPLHSVGFAGLKDRHSVSEQWFSLHLPGRDAPHPGHGDIEGVEVLECTRHTSKLRIGMLAENRFRIVVRELRGDIDTLEARLSAVAEQGAPNYFGPQRFGRDLGNLRVLFDGPPRVDRNMRSHGLSALRSALFNGYLAGRLHDDSWRAPLPGEIVYLPAARRYRHVSGIAGEPAWPTGLLWGSGSNRSTDRARELEQAYFTQFPAVTGRLADAGVRMMRRPLVLKPAGLRWWIQAATLTLEFRLERGAFATSILSELLDMEDVAVAAPPR